MVFYDSFSFTILQKSESGNSSVTFGDRFDEHREPQGLHNRRDRVYGFAADSPIVGAGT